MKTPNEGFMYKSQFKKRLFRNLLFFLVIWYLLSPLVVAQYFNIQLQSRSNDGSCSNKGTLFIIGQGTFNYGSNVYLQTGTYTITAGGCAGVIQETRYSFDHFEYSGGVSVTNPNSGWTTMSINGGGTLTEVSFKWDFNIEATPSSQTVTAGDAAIYNIKVSAIQSWTTNNNEQAHVVVEVLNIPPTVTRSGANDFYIKQSQPTDTETLTLYTKNETPPGTYQITVKGTIESTTTTHSTTITLIVKSKEQPPADLIIQNFYWTPSNPNPGDQVTFTYTEKNQGQGDATGHRVTLYDGDNPILEDNILETLKAGDSRTRTFPDKWTLTPGVHAIFIKADSTNAITESNEENNGLPETMTIQPTLIVQLVSPSDGIVVTSLPIEFKVRVISGGIPIKDANTMLTFGNGGLSSSGWLITDSEGYATYTDFYSLASGSSLRWYAEAYKPGYTSSTSSKWRLTYLSTTTTTTRPYYCYDSDGESNFYVSGYCEDTSGVYNDYCSDKYAYDYYCSIDGYCSTTSKYCTYGCVDGVCEAVTTTTTTIPITTTTTTLRVTTTSTIVITTTTSKFITTSTSVTTTFKPYKPCSELNGNICADNQICPQDFIPALDTVRCCPVKCERTTELISESMDALSAMNEGMRRSAKIIDKNLPREGTTIASCAVEFLPSKSDKAIEFLKMAGSKVIKESGKIIIEKRGFESAYEQDIAPALSNTLTRISQIKLMNKEILDSEYVEDMKTYFNFIKKQGQRYPSDLDKLVEEYKAGEIKKTIAFVGVGLGLILIPEPTSKVGAIILFLTKTGVSVTSCVIDFETDEDLYSLLLNSYIIKKEEFEMHNENILRGLIELANENTVDNFPSIKIYDSPIIPSKGKVIKNMFNKPLQINVIFEDSYFLESVYDQTCVAPSITLYQTEEEGIIQPNELFSLSHPIVNGEYSKILSKWLEQAHKCGYRKANRIVNAYVFYGEKDINALKYVTLTESVGTGNCDKYQSDGDCPPMCNECNDVDCCGNACKSPNGYITSDNQCACLGRTPISCGPVVITTITMSTTTMPPTWRCCNVDEEGCDYFSGDNVLGKRKAWELYKQDCPYECVNWKCKVFGVTTTTTTLPPSITTTSIPTTTTILPTSTTVESNIYLITINTNVDGASVSLDGTYKCTTSKFFPWEKPHCTINVPVDIPFTIEVTKEGYFSYAREFTRSPSSFDINLFDITISVDLVKSVYSITVQSNVDGALVYLDDNPKCTTSRDWWCFWCSYDCAIRDVSSGSHIVKVTKTGYFDNAKVVTGPPDTIVKINTIKKRAT